MLIYGHEFIKNKSFYHISNIQSVSNTPPSSTVLVDFDEKNIDIIEHAVCNSISLAIKAKNITQIIYASALGASFILVPKELAKTAQNLANNYLFDAKILVETKEEKEIEELAILGVDGVIFANAVIKIN